MKNPRQRNGLTIRRGYALLYFIIFLLSAPVLLLYSYGYRYDAITHRLLRTGVLSLSSVPSGATVILDGDDTGRTTPAYLPSLFPREYTVHLEKTGFHPWEKRLAVEPNAATLAEGAVLFFAEPERTASTFQGVSAQYIGNNSARYLLANDASPTWIVRDDQTTISADTAITGFGSTVNSVSASPRTRSLAVGTPSRTLLYDLDSNKLLMNVAASASRIAWLNDTTMAALGSGSVAIVNLGATTTTTVPTKGWTDIAETNGHLFGVRPTRDGTTVEAIATDTGAVTERAVLPVLSHAIIAATRSDNAVIADEQTAETYLIQALSNAPSVTSLGRVGPRATWKADGSAILVFNKFEIGVWEIDAQTYTLLSRSSDPIADAVWLGSLPIIVIAQRAGITTLELDGRGGRQSILLSADQTDKLDSSNDGKTLRYVADGQAITSVLRP